MPKIYNYVKQYGLPDGGTVGQVVSRNALGQPTWTTITSGAGDTYVIENDLIPNITPYVTKTVESNIDTWIDIYTNDTANKKCMYFMSILNPNEYEEDPEELQYISLRLVDSSNNEIFRIIPTTSLTELTGIENSISQYIINPTYKIQFKTNIVDAECYLSIGNTTNDVNQYTVTISETTKNIWTPIYENNTNIKKYLKLICSNNNGNLSADVCFRIFDSNNNVVCNLTPYVELPTTYGVENNTSVFILLPTQKLMCVSTQQDVQFLVVLQDILTEQQVQNKLLSDENKIKDYFIIFNIDNTLDGLEGAAKTTQVAVVKSNHLTHLQTTYTLVPIQSYDKNLYDNRIGIYYVTNITNEVYQTLLGDSSISSVVESF